MRLSSKLRSRQWVQPYPSPSITTVRARQSKANAPYIPYGCASWRKSVVYQKFLIYFPLLGLFIVVVLVLSAARQWLKKV